MQIVTAMKQSYEPIDEGVWEADITRLFEWKEFNRFDNKEKEGLKFEFTIAEGRQKGERAYRFINPFLTPKSILWSLWRAAKGGEDPTAEDLGGIHDISDLIANLGGRPVKLIVKNRRSSKGNIYYNITEFMKSSRLQGEYPFAAGAPEGMHLNDSSSGGSVPTNKPNEEHVTVAPTPAPAPAQPTMEPASAKSIADELDKEEVAKATGKPA